MKKNLLIKRLSSCKIPLMVLLLAICTCYTAVAQNRQITGKVTSGDDGSALPGVSVRLKGTNLGTVTDVNGIFKISAAKGNVLTFTFIGYDAQDVAVGDGSAYNVTLAPNARTLAEVNVVSVGYGTQKRTDLSGSISSVSAATIEKVPVTTLDQALQGRMAGVQVTNNDGTPGGNVTVLVRGIGSLASFGNGPLYVVDGYPIDAGGMNNINPNDIASIDVLKDASATAIYGIRAANGVVLITTKRGKKDGVVVSFDAYDAFQAKPKEYSVLNAQQFATLSNSLQVPGGYSSFAGWANPASLHNIDWQNAIYRTGLTQSYSLGFRGGSDKVQSATSIGYYDQQGIVQGAYFKRITFSTNADYQPVKWLRSSTNVKYTYQESANPFGSGNLLQLSQLPPTLDGGNKLTNLVKDSNGNYGFFNPTPADPYANSYNNPLYSIETNRNYGLNNFFATNTSLEATLVDGLKIKTNGGVNISDFAGQFFIPQDLRGFNQYGSRVNPAFYNQNVNTQLDWLWENTLTYDKTFGKHGINVILGTSEQKTFWNGMGGSGIPPNGVIRDLAQVTNLQLNINSPPGSNSGNGQNITSLQSYFARATYQFDNKYILTGTIRRDGSSKFDPTADYGTFPSGAVAWKAKQESFLKNVSWLSDLKVRGSYGEVGNQGSILPFQYLALYTGNLPASVNGGNLAGDNLGYPFNKIYQTGISASQPANPTLKWETDTQADVGVDASFLNGDLTLTADWFDRKSKDFLLNLAAPAQTGFNFLTKNVGSMENKGLEFALNYNHKASGDFQYGAALTITTVDNKLTSITSGTTQVQNFGGLGLQAQTGWNPFSITKVGQGIGEFYGFQTLGIFQTQAQIDALNANAVAKQGAGAFYERAVTQPGDRYYKDINGDGIVNGLDQTGIGSPLPKFYGGLDLSATYKSWDFNAYFYGVYGNKILDFAESAQESFQNRSFVGVENISVNYLDNAWTPSNHSNRYARITVNDDAIGNNLISSTYVENGSFLKLKNFTVGYTLPGAFARKIAVTKVRLYFSTQNLFTITSYKGLDPEIGIQGGNATQSGIDNGTYPSSKYYTVGLSVTL